MQFTFVKIEDRIIAFNDRQTVHRSSQIKQEKRLFETKSLQKGGQYCYLNIKRTSLVAHHSNLQGGFRTRLGQSMVTIGCSIS